VVAVAPVVPLLVLLALVGPVLAEKTCRVTLHPQTQVQVVGVLTLLAQT